MDVKAIEEALKTFTKSINDKGWAKPGVEAAARDLAHNFELYLK